jgi:aldo/keto reductase family protein
VKYRTIGADPKTRREVSVLSLGAMRFGTTTDEATSFAILDRYVAAGGTFIDTSDNYAFWVNGTQGGESEELLGRWRRSRGVGDEIVIATKVGARPLAPGTSYTNNREGLSAKVIRESAERSRERLGAGQPNWRISQPGPATAAPAASQRRRSSRSAVTTTRRPVSRPARPAISSSPSPRAATTRTRGAGPTRSSTARARPSTTR